MHPNPDHEARVAADARNRAWRTFVAGIALDVLVAAMLAVSAAVSAEIEWTADYWRVVALLAAKSAVQALVASLARRALPPRVDT